MTIFAINLRSIDDALNCTSDIIDEDCSREQGKIRFDKWNMALVNTYYELCDYQGEDDKILLRGIPLKTLVLFLLTHQIFLNMFSLIYKT
jgi:hypothetical protein